MPFSINYKPTNPTSTNLKSLITMREREREREREQLTSQANYMPPMETKIWGRQQPVATAKTLLLCGCLHSTVELLFLHASGPLWAMDNGGVNKWNHYLCVWNHLHEVCALWKAMVKRWNLNPLFCLSRVTNHNKYYCFKNSNLSTIMYFFFKI